MPFSPATDICIQHIEPPLQMQRKHVLLTVSMPMHNSNFMEKGGGYSLADSLKSSTQIERCITLFLSQTNIKSLKHHELSKNHHDFEQCKAPTWHQLSMEHFTSVTYLCCSREYVTTLYQKIHVNMNGLQVSNTSRQSNSRCATTLQGDQDLDNTWINPEPMLYLKKV